MVGADPPLTARRAGQLAMMQIVLIGLGAGAASALLFASIASGSLLSFALANFAQLPIMLAAIGWTHLPACSPRGRIDRLSLSSRPDRSLSRSCSASARPRGGSAISRCWPARRRVRSRRGRMVSGRPHRRVDRDRCGARRPCHDAALRLRRRAGAGRAAARVGARACDSCPARRRIPRCSFRA